MKAYQGCDFSWADCEYIGQQERLGKFSLDTFNDLGTNSTFLRSETETVLEARDRIKNKHKKK